MQGLWEKDEGGPGLKDPAIKSGCKGRATRLARRIHSRLTNQPSGFRSDVLQASRSVLSSFVDATYGLRRAISSRFRIACNAPGLGSTERGTAGFGRSNRKMR
jgi:hypothetical protein